jgi:mRNA interferase MazF
MRQYEIRWATLPPPIGRRPVLLLTRTPAYAYLNKVIVAEITSTIREIAQEVTLDADEGLSRRSVANLDNIHVIPKAAIQERLGRLSGARERDVKRALGYALDWAELKSI